MMLEGMLGKKLGMSRIFDAEGNSLPVTLIECGPCYVSGRTGTDRVQLAFEEVSEKSLSKAEAGHLRKNKLPMLRHLREVKWSGKADETPSPGDKITAAAFSEGEKVDIQGVSKGKGFSGVMKRWNFGGGRKTHGGTTPRGPGSIGAGSDPSRVWPGMKMAGRYGGDKVTAFNLEIVKIDSNENTIAVKGSVPGPGKALVFIRRSLKVK